MHGDSSYSHYIWHHEVYCWDRICSSFQDSSHHCMQSFLRDGDIKPSEARPSPTPLPQCLPPSPPGGGGAVWYYGYNLQDWSSQKYSSLSFDLIKHEGHQSEQYDRLRVWLTGKSKLKTYVLVRWNFLSKTAENNEMSIDSTRVPHILKAWHHSLSIRLEIG